MAGAEGSPALHPREHLRLQEILTRLSLRIERTDLFHRRLRELKGTYDDRESQEIERTLFRKGRSHWSELRDAAVVGLERRLESGLRRAELLGLTLGPRRPGPRVFRLEVSPRRGAGARSRCARRATACWRSYRARGRGGVGCPEHPERRRERGGGGRSGGLYLPRLPSPLRVLVAMGREPSGPEGDPGPSGHQDDRRAKTERPEAPFSTTSAQGPTERVHSAGEVGVKP
jgi:hypothetical protein